MRDRSRALKHSLLQVFDWSTSLGGRANAHTARFLRFTAISSITFAVDLFLLFAFTDWLGIHYLVSVVLAFLIAITINYVFVRPLVFPESTRPVGTGYVYFVVIITVGASLSVALMAFMVEVLGLHYLLARILIACFVGFWNYLMNAYVNFRVHRIE